MVQDIDLQSQQSLDCWLLTRGDLMKDTVLIRTLQNEYVYDRASNNIYELSNGGNDLINEDRNSINLMIDKIEHPETRLLKYKYERKLSVITLQITQQCNLRCEYCVYSGKYQNRGHSSEIMDDTVARQSIDFLALHSIDSSHVHIGFYGGEPLLRFQFIKDQIDYAHKRLHGKQITFGLTTNGTLLNREIIEYFAENNVSIIISLDGDKVSHDKNRKFANSEKGSFDIIINKLKEICEFYPEYFKTISFNVVIDPETPFKNTALFFKNNSLINNSFITAGLISNQYVVEEALSSEIFKEEYGYELFKYFLYKLNVLKKEDVSNLFEGYFRGIKRIEDREITELESTAHHGGPCVPGVQKLFVGIDGTLYPCERVNEESEVMKIGTVFDGFIIEKALTILNIGEVTKEECKQCWAFRFCTICASSADDTIKFSKQKKLKACKTVKQSTLVLLKNYCMLKEFGYTAQEED